MFALLFLSSASGAHGRRYIQLIVPNGVVPIQDIAGLTRNHKVPQVVVSTVPVEMIGYQCAGTCSSAGLPVDEHTTTMTRVGSGTYGVPEDHPMLRNVWRLERKRMPGRVHHSVSGGSGGALSTCGGRALSRTVKSGLRWVRCEVHTALGACGLDHLPILTRKVANG